MKLRTVKCGRVVADLGTGTHLLASGDILIAFGFDRRQFLSEAAGYMSTFSWANFYASKCEISSYVVGHLVLIGD